MLLDPETLKTVGEALYGSRWQSQLARDLSVSDRTVRRWVAGTAAIPAGIEKDLMQIIDEKAAALVTVRAKLLHPQYMRYHYNKPIKYSYVYMTENKNWTWKIQYEDGSFFYSDHEFPLYILAYEDCNLRIENKKWPVD